MGKKSKANKSNKPNKTEIKIDIISSYNKYRTNTKERYQEGYLKRPDIIAENDAFFTKFRKFKLTEENRKTLGNSEVNKEFYYCYGHCLWDKIRILLEGVVYSNGVYMPQETLEIDDISHIYSVVLDLKDEAVDVLDFSVGIKTNSISDYSSLERECIRLKRNVLKDAANMSYVCADYERYVSLAELAVENGSVQACSTLVAYYVDINELNKANHYFEKTLSMPVNKTSSFGILMSIESAKQMSYSYMYHGYYNVGDYERAISIAEQSISYFKATMVLKTKLSFKKWETIALQWIEECNEAIAGIAKERSSEGHLKQYFEDSVISLMSEDVKIYIDTSLEVYDYIKGCENNLDYSATLMPIMKAVESLVGIIMNRFLAFLHTKKNINLRYVNKSLKHVGKNPKDDVLLNSLDRFEIGKAEKCIAWLPPEHMADSAADIKQSYFRPDIYFIEFCRENGIEQPKDTTRRFALLLHLVKEKRNLVAHKNRVVENDAETCYDYLLTGMKFIEFLLVNFSFCFMETDASLN